MKFKCNICNKIGREPQPDLVVPRCRVCNTNDVTYIIECQDCYQEISKQTCIDNEGLCDECLEKVEGYNEEYFLYHEE